MCSYDRRFRSIGSSIFESFFKTRRLHLTVPCFVTKIISRLPTRSSANCAAGDAHTTLASPCRTSHLNSPLSPNRWPPRFPATLGAGIEHLRVLASGWETTLYEFELSGPSAMLPELKAGVPLVLRFYPSVEAAGKGALEYRTISHLASAGYPVPRPYVFEPGGAAIGAPFLVMERLGGGPLFAIRSFPQAFKTFSMGFLAFVRAQARLHRMALAQSALELLRSPAVANYPERANTAGRTNTKDGVQNGSQDPSDRLTQDDEDGAAERLLERTLETVAARVEQGPLPGLAAALARLRARAPEFRSAPPSFSPPRLPSAKRPG